MVDKIERFSRSMALELVENSHKGSIFDWCDNSSFEVWLYEFEYHKAKLIAAVMAKDKEQKKEYCADLANYLMALSEREEFYILQKSITLTESDIKIIK